MERGPGPGLRVLVVEDHAVVRRGLCVVLESAGLTCVADVGTGAAAERAVRDHAPDVVLLDLGLPDMDGLQLLRRLQTSAPRVAVVVLTMHAEEEYVLRALAAGAGGYVLKLAELEAVVEAIARAVNGELYIDPAVARSVARRAVREPEADPLTPRERDVLERIARGLTNRQIAGELFISPNTVETHRRHILEKLGARSRAELVAQALERGLLRDNGITSER
ncbi:MAG TPA: response regulator transcription factor [Actinomycetota bacterium]|nr:response regulator transcription factor [Actinomycetota bacterium]